MARKPKKSAKSLKTKIPLDPEEEALLLRCLETPWDDAPILVYADWVQDNKEDERAEFIRNGLKTNRLQMKLPPSVKNWASDVLPDGAGSNEWYFLRGLPIRFVTEQCESREWPEVDIYGQPEISESSDLSSTIVDSVTERLDVIEGLGWPIGLQFFSWDNVDVSLEGNELMSILSHPSISKVSVFILDAHTMDMNEIETIATSKFFENMWYIECPLLTPGSEACESLKSSPHLKKLRFMESDRTSFL